MSTVYVNFFSQITEVAANRFMAACAEIIRVDRPQSWCADIGPEWRTVTIGGAMPV
jgi:hypothetical protein